MRWYPVVSFLQVLVDVAIAKSAPVGHGHLYSSADYANAWIAVTDVQGWSAGEIARLKEHLLLRPGRAGSKMDGY